MENEKKVYTVNDEAATERLALLSEELAESIQAVGKILRHGFASKSPFDMTNRTNKGDLEKELGHVLAAVMLMDGAGDLDCVNIVQSSQDKLDEVKKYLHAEDNKEILNRDHPRAERFVKFLKRIIENDQNN